MIRKDIVERFFETSGNGDQSGGLTVSVKMIRTDIVERFFGTSGNGYQSGGLTVTVKMIRNDSEGYRRKIF
jgi:hypothetical protein